MTNEAIRLILILVQAGVTVLTLGVLTSKVKAVQRSSPERGEEAPKDVRSLGVLTILSLILLIALWTIPSRLIQDTAPNTVSVVQEDMSNSDAEVNPVAEPTPDPFEQNRKENEAAKERFLNLE